MQGQVLLAHFQTACEAFLAHASVVSIASTVVHTRADCEKGKKNSINPATRSQHYCRTAQTRRFLSSDSQHPL